ncbi:hypothetical protein BGX30_007375, partial [Mortierella sp. GBA39]
IWIKNVPELSAQYALVKAGKLDWYDGTPPKDILESLLKQNKDLVHYRMYDPASVGLMYNIRNKPFDNLKFRQALTYVLDKKKLQVDKSVLDQMTDYTTNLDKAAELLKEIGWTKGSDGLWRDPDGKVPSFIIGAPNNWAPGVNSAQIAAEQFTKFGIPTKLKAVDSTIYFSNADKGQYDMSMDWVDVSWGFQNPWSSMRVLFWQGTKTKVGFPNVKKKDADGNEVDTGKLDLKLKGIDGKVYDIDKEMKRFPYVQDEQERRKIIDNLAWIANENCWGVNFFQNATGAWLNTKTMSGNFPMMDQIVQYNRDMPLATDPDEQLAITHLNHGFNSTAIDTWARDFATQRGMSLEEAYRQITAMINYNPKEPIFTQLGRYLGGLLHGNLGMSMIYQNVSVNEIIANALPWTLFVLSVSLVINLGAMMAFKRKTVLDPIISIYAILTSSVPNFIVGILLLVIFAFQFGWFP